MPFESMCLYLVYFKCFSYSRLQSTFIFNDLLNFPPPCVGSVDVLTYNIQF